MRRNQIEFLKTLTQCVDFEQMNLWIDICVNVFIIKNEWNIIR